MVDVLTKSISKEDLEALTLFVKAGSADESLWLEIEKEGTSLVKGEVSLVAGDKYKNVGLDLLVYNAAPIVGTVDVVKLGLYMAEARLSRWNEDLLEKTLAKLNATIDVKVMFVNHVEFFPVVDEESGRISIEPFVVADDNPEGRLSISELIAMFS